VNHVIGRITLACAVSGATTLTRCGLQLHRHGRVRPKELMEASRFSTGQQVDRVRGRVRSAVAATLKIRTHRSVGFDPVLPLQVLFA
jgi:hypothetical protein